MRLLPVLLVFSLIEAKRRRPGNLEKLSENLDNNHKTNNVDVYPEAFQPVDFGHVYNNKNKDPNYKKSDEFEPDMAVPRNLQHARQLLKQAGSDVEWAKKVEEPLGFPSPRDAMRYLNPSGRREGYELSRIAYRPAGIRNIPQTMSKSFKEEVITDTLRHPEIPPQERFDNASRHGFFSRAGFDLILSEETHYTGNWTTCKEFAKGAVFHPDDVINIEWLPFYIWSKRHFSTAHIHKFSYLTKKLVVQYKEKYDPFLNIKVDWEEPKLLMQELKDMILIAGDRKGLFYGIPIIDLPSNAKRMKIKIPVIVLRLKIVDPYLAMMYCDENYATIMAVAGTEPESNEEKTSEAIMLKFEGIGNPALRDLQQEMIRERYKIPRRANKRME